MKTIDGLILAIDMDSRALADLSDDPRVVEIRALSEELTGLREAASRDEDQRRIRELRLAIRANSEAEQASDNEIVRRQCRRRIADAQDELTTLEHLESLYEA